MASSSLIATGRSQLGWSELFESPASQEKPVMTISVVTDPKYSITLNPDNAPDGPSIAVKFSRTVSAERDSHSWGSSLTKVATGSPAKKIDSVNLTALGYLPFATFLKSRGNGHPDGMEYIDEGRECELLMHDIDGFASKHRREFTAKFVGNDRSTLKADLDKVVQINLTKQYRHNFSVKNALTKTEIRTRFGFYPRDVDGAANNAKGKCRRIELVAKGWVPIAPAKVMEEIPSKHRKDDRILRYTFAAKVNDTDESITGKLFRKATSAPDNIKVPTTTVTIQKTTTELVSESVKTVSTAISETATRVENTAPWY